MKWTMKSGIFLDKLLNFIRSLKSLPGLTNSNLPLLQLLKERLECIDAFILARFCEHHWKRTTIINYFFFPQRNLMQSYSYGQTFMIALHCLCQNTEHTFVISIYEIHQNGIYLILLLIFMGFNQVFGLITTTFFYHYPDEESIKYHFPML